jgi:hypothetical protein
MSVGLGPKKFLTAGLLAAEEKKSRTQSSVPRPDKDLTSLSPLKFYPLAGNIYRHG